MIAKSELRILTIDDEMLIRQNIRDYLEDSGYVVFEAENGRVGLEMFHQEKPDIILCDLHMPEVDGLEVLKKVKEESPETPVIIISGTGSLHTAIEATRLGAWDFILKPLQDMTFMEHVICKVWERAALIRENRMYREHLEEEIKRRTEDLKKEVQEHKLAKQKIERLNDELELRIAERTDELRNSLKRLKNTQEQMIAQEKIAALGKLVASVAHEINTPLGAIQSSVGMMLKNLKETLLDFPFFFVKLSPNLQNDFMNLVHRSLNQDDLISIKMKRQYKKEINRRLSELYPENSMLIADTLIDMRIYEDVDSIMPLLESPDWDHILHVAYDLTVLFRSAQTIMTATSQASNVVLALKTFSRLETSQEKVASSVISGIETALTLYHHKIKHGIEVVRQYQEDLPIIQCYPDELNQVWTNLIDNALYAMDFKGKLTIQAIKNNGEILVSVADTGVGIPQNDQSKIFDPFFSTKQSGEGCGLGLDIVRKIIEKHQGEITVESIPGNTKFTVAFPIH